MPEIEIRFASDREYALLCHIRDKYGVQWRGMLLQGAKRLEDQSLATRPATHAACSSIEAETTDPATEQQRSES